MCLTGVVLALALAARLVWLDTLPGVNGDEAWYGLWIETALRDRVWGGATPTGNLPNPFFLVPLGIVQALAPPAPWVLRAPAVLAGLGFVAVGYACLRAHVGRSPAAIFVLLAATAPTAIAYARFGWDASETPLAAVILLWCCLSGKQLWAAVALVAAFVVHPANVFLAPIFAAFLSEDMKPWVEKYAGGAVTRHLLGILVAGGAMVALALALRLGSIGPSEMASAAYWLRIAGLFSDLFSGVTVFSYIVGPPDGIILHRVIASLVLVVSLGVLLIGARSVRDSRATALLAGLALSVVAFAVFVGPSGLSPHRERYALFFVAPVLLLVSMALGRAFGEHSAGGVWFAATLGCLALVSMWVNYFEPLRLTGGRSHETFRTAAIEPKLQTANWIEASARRCGSIVAWAESWWLAEPLHYFLFYRSDIAVRQFDEGSLPNAGVCDDLIVTFADSPSDESVAGRGVTRLTTIPAASGEALIQIYGVEAKDSQLAPAGSFR